MTEDGTILNSTGTVIPVIPAPAFAEVNPVPAKAGTYCGGRNPLRKQGPISTAEIH